MYMTVRRNPTKYSICIAVYGFLYEPIHSRNPLGITAYTRYRSAERYRLKVIKRISYSVL